MEQLLFPDKYDMLHALDAQTGPQFQRLNEAVRAPGARRRCAGMLKPASPHAPWQLWGLGHASGCHKC